MRKLSLAAVTLRGLAPRQLIEAAAEAGFDAVGVRLSPWPQSTERISPAEVRKVAALSRSLGVSVNDVEQIRLVPNMDAQSYEYLFEGAARLGARYVLIYADEPDEERFADRLRELDRLGRPYGVAPVIEPMPFTTLRTPAAGVALLKRAQLLAPAMLIDTLHFARGGGSAADLDTLEPALLPFVHLADALIPGPKTAEGLREEATFWRRLPGQGDLPLRDYLDHLPAGVPLALEVPGASTGSPLERAMIAAAVTRSWLHQGGLA